MKNISVCLLAVSAWAYPFQADAISLNQNSDFVFGSSDVSSSALSLNLSHTTPLELKPISHFSSGIKTAAVKSLVGLNKRDDFGIDYGAQCHDEGYTLVSCPDGKVPSSICPHTDTYFKSCICDTSVYPEIGSQAQAQANCGNLATIETCTSGGVSYYKCECTTSGKSTCTAPNSYTGNADFCTHNGQKYFESTDCRMCDSPQIVNDTKDGCTCPSSWTTCSANQVGNGSACTADGDNKYVSCSCPASFKQCDASNNEVGSNECIDNGISYFGTCSCPSGWSECEDGGDTGAKKCDKDGRTYWSSCKPKPKDLSIECKVGSVLYDDKKCYEGTFVDKTPIAVVFDTVDKLAVALEEYGQDFCDYNSCVDYGYITGLETCTADGYAFNCTINGKENTALIIEDVKKYGTPYPAAEFCYNFTTPGTSAGEWYLPSQRELLSLYNTRAIVDATLNLLGKSPVADDWYWSSTTDGYMVYYFDMSGGIYEWSTYDADFSNYARPVLQYDTPVQQPCEIGGYQSSVPTNKRCVEVAYGGNTCYGYCTQLSCSDGGYYSSIPANNTCTQITYAGNTCYKDCRYQSCETGGYKSSIPSNNRCTSVSYAGKTCYKDCYQPSCSDGGYNSSTPSGQSCTPVTYYGRTCYGNCRVSCPAGNAYYVDGGYCIDCMTVAVYGRKDCMEYAGYPDYDSSCEMSVSWGCEGYNERSSYCGKANDLEYECISNKGYQYSKSYWSYN